MANADNNMDKIFRDKLGDFSQQPPEDIWAGIKSGIEKKPRRKILIPLWQAAAGMALIIATGGILYFLNRPANTGVADQLLLRQDSSTIKNLEIANAIPDRSDKKDVGKLIKPEFSNHEMIQKRSKNESETSDLNTREELIIGNHFPRNQANPVNTINLHFDAEGMNRAYLVEVAFDKIPRKKNAYAPGWDIITSDGYLGEQAEESPNNLLLTAQVSPTYSYRDIANPGALEFNQYESGKISYSGGLQIGYKTSERLSLHAGLMFSQLAYEVNNVNKYYANLAATDGTDVLSTPGEKSFVYAAKNSIGTINSANSGSIFVAENNAVRGEKDFYSNVSSGVNSSAQTEGLVNQVFQYIEIPFLLRYKILDRKFGVNLLGGLSTNILMGNRTSLTIDGETSNIGSSQNIRNVNYMGNMGLGFDYQLNKSVIFTMEPQFKYFLNSINQSNLIANRPYMLGVFTGVRLVW